MLQNKAAKLLTSFIYVNVINSVSMTIPKRYLIRTNSIETILLSDDKLINSRKQFQDI